MLKVFLDAGHGGSDPGAIGNNLKEKDVNLSVTLKVGEILKRHNVEVVYSRTTDVFLELNERAKRANDSNADVFVSVHCNSFADLKAQGLETFSSTNSQKGTALAKCIQDSLIADKLYTKNRGIKTANFAVLRLTNMVAALVELAFISNLEDSKILINKQDELALSVAKGILNFLGIKYVDKVAENKKEEKELNSIQVNLHGKTFEVKGVYQEGVNYIPIRFLEKLGYEIDWKNETVVINYKEVK